MGIFMTAQEARQGAVNHTIIYNEIRDIEKLIIDAVSGGRYTLDINTTYMTSIPTGLNYFRIWKCLDCGVETSYDQLALLDQMNQTMSHFKDLGYNIERRITSINDSVFYWRISW